METIQITKDNFKDFTDLDIAAFSFAEGGAMGEGGGIIIADSKGKWYHTNYAWGDFPYKCIPEIIPAFGDCRFGMFGIESTVPEGWFYCYLGMGNHLVVKESLKNQFDEKAKDIHTPPELYGAWMEIIEELVPKTA